MSFAVTGAVIGAAGVAYSVYSSEKAAGKAKKAGKEQARIEKDVTAERLVQIKREEMLMREATVAGAAGSGVKTTSQSALEVLADQKAQFAREAAITKKVGASAAKNALAQGSLVAQQYRAQGISQGAQGLSNVFNILSSTGKFG